MDNLIIVILFVTGISLFLNTLLKKINIDVIIGYILTGAIVGYLFSLQGVETSTLDVIAELGIAFLMFTIGVEFSVDKLKQIRKEVFVYGGAQVFLTAIVFYCIARYGFSLTTITSFVIALGLSLSSTAIVLKLLNENKLLYRTYGKNALGVLIFQDIIVIPVLLTISILSQINSGVGNVVSDMLFNTLILSIIFIVWERYLAKKFLDIIVSSKSDELFVAAILFLVIGAAQLANSFGFSYSLGAFVAGLIIAKTQYKHQVEADLIPFRDLLLGIFFITVGMQLDLTFIPQNITSILLILGAIILIKAILIFLIMSFGYRRQTSLKTAIILAQVGEFSFVIFEVAKLNNLFVDTVLTQTIIASIIFSMALTPFIFRNIKLIENLFIRKKDDHSDEEALDGFDLSNHIIICGYGALGKRLAKNLRALAMPYVILERDHTLVKEGLAVGDNIILGNGAKKKILNRVNIENAKAVVVAIPQEDKMMRVVDVVRLAAPNIKIVTKASSLYQRDFFASMGLVLVVDELTNTSESIVKILKTKI